MRRISEGDEVAEKRYGKRRDAARKEAETRGIMTVREYDEWEQGLLRRFSIGGPLED